MALNTIAYAQVLQTALDKKAVATLTSGFMDANAGQVIYNGGRDIKIPKMSLTGLMDYDKDMGYTMGSVTLEYETKTMTMDRGTGFQLDAMDVGESNFIASASTVAGEFQRTQVVPEVDAYRYSRIAALAEGNKTECTPEPETIFGALIDDIAKVRDLVGENEEIVVSINSLVKAKLEKLEKFTKMLAVAEFTSGEINTKVKAVNNAVLLPVPSARMMDSYIFADGKTDGQKSGGFKAADGAKQINWIVMPKKAAIGVCKQDKMKIFDPDTYQKADAWFLGYRKYHDVWIKDNMLEAVIPNIQPVISETQDNKQEDSK